MITFNIEKHLNELPEVIVPNSIYLIQDRYGRLDIYVTDKAGALAISNKQELYTTPKIEIVNNKILLPSRPEGDVLFNMMQVYDIDDSLTEYNEVTVLNDTYKSYAILNEPDAISGYGVVTYLTRPLVA